MAFVLLLLLHQNRSAAPMTMKSKNKSIASICILLFHLGLLYLAYEKIAGNHQPSSRAQAEMQTARP